MGLWFLMFIIDLLIPVIMLVFGSYASKNAPKEINYLFGYRTNMSMKNIDTWVFAHNYCGKVWTKVGRIMLPASIVIMLFSIGKKADAISLFGGVLLMVQLVVLILSIIPTERALKRTFDKDGKRR